MPNAVMLPRITIIFPFALSLKRARRRNERQGQRFGTDENCFEREDDGFSTRVYNQYRENACREAKSFIPIDCETDIERVAEGVPKVMCGRLAADGQLLSTASERAS